MNNNYRPLDALSYFITSLFLMLTSVLHAQMITTVAGGSIGDGKPATAVGLNYFNGIVTDSAENLYILDNGNSRIRKITAATGIISTIAGIGVGQISGDGGMAINAVLENVQSIGIDRPGNIYVIYQDRIRKIDAVTGIINTITAIGAGSSGDGGPAINAHISNPSYITSDTAGNLYFGEGSRIRKITVATGIITTVAGTGVSGYSGDGGPAINAKLGYVRSVATDAAGNIYAADINNFVIRKITAATGIITTYAGKVGSGNSGDGGLAINTKLNYINALIADPQGNLFILESQKIRKINATTGIINTIAGNGSSGYPPDGINAYNAQFPNAAFLCLSRTGNLYIDDRDNFVIRKIEAGSNLLSTVCGNRTMATGGFGGPVSAAQLFRTYSIACDKFNDIYLADFYNNKIYRIDASTKIFSIVAGTGIAGYTGDNGLATSANIARPGALAVDSLGNFYFSNSGSVIRKVTVATGIISTVAGTGTTGYTGDGGPASAAKISGVSGLAFDSSGNLFFTDTDNSVVRKVAAYTGVITTVIGIGTAGNSGDGGLATAAQMVLPYGISVDHRSNLYISDFGSDVVRRVDGNTGIITTVTGKTGPGYSGDGGPAIDAKINTPFGLATDTAGNVYIADRPNMRVRKINVATGIMTTAAGTTNGSDNDSIPASTAALHDPISLCFDTSGNLLISEYGNYKIRKILYDTVQHAIDNPPSLENPNTITTKVYPNPTHDQIEVSLKGNINGKVLITVMDIWGKQIVSRQTAFQQTDNYNIPLQLPPLQSGIYFVTVYVNKSKYVTPLFIH